MSEQSNDPGTARDTAPVITPDKRKTNGSRNHKTADPLPGVSVRELLDERDWPALAGLALVTLGLLVLVADVFNLRLVLWAWMLLGAGGWLVFDAWQKYQAAGRQWVGSTRNRLLFGGLIALVGLFGTLHVDWWAMLLLGAGAWLAYDTRKQANARRGWTHHLRNRMFVASVVALIGFLALFPSWSAWPLLLIVAGAVMLYRHGRG